ncbi:MAG: pectinesterase family protein [Butyrivibrio sp.]|nr:pectinesterase family protein [Muribaculum sp.]MCM1552035.1 pectinesterase family protein [Butyrivibrio sp.]
MQLKGYKPMRRVTALVLSVILTLGSLYTGGMKVYAESDSGEGAISGDIADYGDVSRNDEVSGGDNAGVGDAVSGEDIVGGEDADSVEVTLYSENNGIEALADTHTVWIVGDSTVCEYPGTESEYYYKRCGYGAQLKEFLKDDTYTVKNLAVSGTSSKSFTSNANYTTLTNGIAKGDVLIIGFGHNDEKNTDTVRYTSPTGDYKTEGSFAKSLYDNYIKIAAQKEADVILCTPIVRRTTTKGSWSDDKLHVTSEGSYPNAIKTLVSDLKTKENITVTLVDLTTLTKELYDTMEAADTACFHAEKPKGTVDNTHLNAYGAKTVTKLFVEALEKDSTCTLDLKEHIASIQCTPDKTADYVPNPDWKEPTQTPETGELAQSTLWDDYVVKTEGKEDVHFKGTAFGTLNGNITKGNHILETDAAGDMHIAVKNNKGKFSSAEDAFDMYYYRVPADANFTLSAKALLNDFDTNQQAGFGLVAHDRVRIDTNETYIADYVVAGSLGTGTNCFKRKNLTFESGGGLKTETLQKGKTYDLSLSWQDEGFTCKFGQETAQSEGFDYPLTAKDSEYVYIGMFCTRNADVTFSNIVLTVNGVEIANNTKAEYAVTVAAGEHGSGSADKQTASKGGKVTLTAVPDKGYVLDKWEVVSGGVSIENNLTFTMPEGAVTVKPVFKAMPTEWSFRKNSSTPNILMGKVGNNADDVAIDGSVAVRVQNAKALWQGLEIDASDSAAVFDTLNRGDWAQVNTGTIVKVPIQEACKVTVQAYSANIFTVNGTLMTDKTLTLGCVPRGDGNDYVTIVAKANDYLGSIKVVKADVTENNVTVSVAGDEKHGTVTSSHAKATEGTLVTLTVTPGNGYVLTGWNVIKGNVTVKDNSFTMPNEEVELEAVFEQKRTEWIFKTEGDKTSSFTGDDAIAVQGETKVVAGLTVDATATGAKWDSTGTAASGGVQINKGTKVHVPVDVPEGGAVMVTVKVVTYQTDQLIGFTVDGEVLPEDCSNVSQTIVCEGKNSEVVLESTLNSMWLYQLKVEPVEYTQEGTYDFTKGSIPDTLKGVTWHGFVAGSTGHGVQTGSGKDYITLSLPQRANISLVTCCYGIGSDLKVTSDSGTVSPSIATSEVNSQNQKTGLIYNIIGAVGDTKLTFEGSGGIYIHSLTIEYAFAPGDRKIDVWDFGGKLEEDEELYTNNITPALWVEKDVLATVASSANPAFSVAGITFGDLTINNALNDRLYSNVDYKPLKDMIGKGSAPGSSIVPTKEEVYSTAGYGEYRPAGGYYGNGAGTSTTKNLSLAHVQAGDKIVVYLGSHQYGDNGDTIEYTIEGTGTAAGQSGTVTITEAEQYKKYEFVAQKSGTYKIYQSQYKPKPLYHRVVRVPGMQVSGTITFPSEFTGTNYALKFVNQSNKQETVATINEDNTYSVVLAPGYAYNAVLTGATGWGITTATKVLQTSDSEALIGKEKNLVVEEKTTYTFSGNIEGFASDYRLDNLVVEMVPVEGNDVNPNADVVELTFADKQTLSFTATLEPDVPYTVRLSGGVSDYRVKSPEVVSENGAYTENIVVELKDKYAVSGGFVDVAGNQSNAKVTALSFVLTETEGEGQLAKTYTYKYPATLTESGYSVDLRAGKYEAEATVNGYATKTHVVVENKAVKKDLLFMSTAAQGALEWVSDIYVGYPKQEHNYATVTDAVEACARMNPSSEAKRITVHIAPGTYREQVIVETPYITFVNDEAGKGKEVLLTWYYGIGYKYYSSKGGFYDVESAFDKCEKAIVDRWGTSVRIKSGATAFRAEGITFENSFNRYITDEEIEDGVEVSGTESITLKREYGVDVTTRAATERAAAIVVEADQSEFLNCKFYSSQDTLYTQCTAYFKNCLIEGMTDYIYGQGSCVFDACELSWKGYESGQKQGGYITAAQTKDGQMGYLFRNCIVTANKKPTATTNTQLTVAPGYLGRCWGGVSTKTMFLNTKLESSDLIVAAGWYEMSNTKPANVPGYQEYNTISLDGKMLDFTDADRACHIMTDAEAQAVKATDYFGSWKPAYYTEEDSAVAFKTAPSLEDNGDMNLLRPGHTLTVKYSLGEANDANDASIIKWYRVKGEDKTLLKTSTAAADKTYKVATEDTGSYIMVEVTPVTVSGKTGTAQSCTTPQTVGEGYEDPSGGTSDIELGKGINVFLAGDSTVKDYSAKGMYNSGKALVEGSWGEFLQSYFDSGKVTIQNYAQGGRSTRNFINEGKLDDIAKNIKEGDYLFIQFGHNDCSNADYSHLTGRYAPLGTADENGIYPSTEGTKDADGQYTWDCGGTYKWYLKQYIQVAREKKAIPVLVTPVARLNYNSDGSIKPHHDENLIGLVPEDGASAEALAAVTTSKANKNKNNSYVTAVRQLAEEENVLLLDAYAITEKLFVDAYNDAKAAGVTPNSTYGQQLMASGDSTHNNKVGGMIEAAAIASAIQGMDLSISKAVKMPQGMATKSPTGETVFTVTNAGKLTMYDILTGYEEESVYWTAAVQKMADAIGEKAKELNGSEEDPNPPAGEQYTITIDKCDGSKPVEKVIEKGTALTVEDLPSNLTREGYTFQGWVDEDGNAVKVPYTPAKSMTIRVNWLKQVAADEYAITIDKCDGSKPVEKVIKKGEALTKKDLPENLNRAGYIFIGWVDGDGKMITAPYIPAKSMTIIAKWLSIPTGDSEGLQIRLLEPDRQYVYTGSAIKPEIVVFNNDEVLKEGTDYTVKYSNNVKAAENGASKAPTITVTGKGRFSGSTAEHFTIGKKELDDDDVVKGSIVVAMNGKAVPVLIYNGMKLGTKDYEFVDSNDAKKKFVENGTIQIQAKANGNYKTDRPLELEVTVVEKLKKLNIVVDTKTKFTYNGTEQTPEIEVYDKDDKLKETPLTPDSDYVVVFSGDKTSAGTQKFTVVGMGGYTGSTAKSYKISPLAVKDTAMFAISGLEESYTYKSTGVTLDGLEVTYIGEASDDSLLQAGKDYKITYSNNKKVSTGTSLAKYSITFLGNYKGSKAIKNQTFKIDKARFEDSDIDVAVKSVDKVYSGKANAYKSAPYVLVNGAVIKSSEYAVEYSYQNAAGEKVVVAGKTKVELADEEMFKLITVTVTCKDKSNYEGFATGTYRVVRKGESQTDLAKAKITLKDKNGSKQSKVEYTGKAVYPDSIVIKVGANPEVILTPNAEGSWDTTEYTVEFVNNIEKGKATVIISAKDGGSYVGCKTATYTVTAQNIKGRTDIWTDFAKMLSM